MTSQTAPIDRLLSAALPHVAFDGWSPTTFRAAIVDADMDTAEARALCPRGALDLAVAFHRAGDAAMLAALDAQDLSDMRYRDKIAEAVWLRLQVVDDKEAVRRGTTLFALPHHAAEGARLIWNTCDQIWTALGDTSADVNWYTKRATLAGVYSATVLYWLGDDSLDEQATRAFLGRRIDNVMQIEKIKAEVRKNSLAQRLLAGPNWIAAQIKAPSAMSGSGLPGSWPRPGSGK